MLPPMRSGPGRRSCASSSRPRPTRAQHVSPARRGSIRRELFVPSRTQTPAEPTTSSGSTTLERNCRRTTTSFSTQTRFRSSRRLNWSLAQRRGSGRDPKPRRASSSTTSSQPRLDSVYEALRISDRELSVFTRGLGLAVIDVVPLLEQRAKDPSDRLVESTLADDEFAEGGDHARVLRTALAQGAERLFGGVDGGVIGARNRLRREIALGQEPGSLNLPTAPGQGFQPT